jgi:hypothetical protein
MCLQRRVSASFPAISDGVKQPAPNRSYVPFSGAWMVIFVLGCGVAFGANETNTHLVFNRDIRPVLSDNCFACHGFDAGKRKAELRLDNAEGAMAIHKGHQAIKPGDLESSELWKRINSTDPKLLMPPPASGKKLKPDQVAVLRQWVLDGAVYQKHWAFEPPVRPEVPTP